MKIGAHISAAGDVSLAPDRAKEFGCECFQFFSRPPQGGKAKPITKEKSKKFKMDCKKYKMQSYIHSPYYINLASENNRIYYGSISVIREELERGSKLGVNALMAHLGSYKNLSPKEGFKKVVKGIDEILKDYKGSTQFLIEISAGAGEIIGDKFEEIAKIINAPKLKKYDIGVCFDTAHAFASGYDLRNEKAVKQTFKEFDRYIGLDKLVLIHINDSKAKLNAKRDKHENIGKGKIGIKGMEAIVKFSQKNNIDLILETPGEDEREKDVKVLKKLRDK